MCGGKTASRKVNVFGEQARDATLGEVKHKVEQLDVDVHKLLVYGRRRL